MRKSMSFHGITADDLKAGGGTTVGLYVNPENAIGFGIDGVHLYFDSPAEFAGWLTKLNALAADTPCVVEAMNPAPECAVIELPAEALADYDRYRETLAWIDCDAEPATVAEWWARFAGRYGATS